MRIANDLSEWLFKRVSAVVHHGGAGTTACGLYNARPTVIVPFFGECVSCFALKTEPPVTNRVIVNHFGAMS